MLTPYPKTGLLNIIEGRLVYDVIVVGAGPAGAILAYLLVSSGLRVLLLEKAALPRYKTCGGGLTFKAIQCLPFDIRSTVEIEASGGIVSYGGQQLLRTEVRQPFAWLVMRDRFDHFLVKRAVQAGMQLLDGARVTGIEQGAHHIQVRTQRGVFCSSLLVGADGVNSIVASLAGLLLQREVGIAIEAEVAVPEAAIESQGSYATFDFGALPGGYGWVFPKRDHLSVGLFQAHRGKAVGLRAALNQFIASQPVLKTQQQICIHGHCIPLGGRKASLDRGRVILVGDAANLADPWLGEGIYYAILSAKIAAEEITGFLKGSLPDLSSYTHRINFEIVQHLQQARKFARLVYLFPQIGSTLLSKSSLMQQMVFDTIRGDRTFRQLNHTLLLRLPHILVQALRGG
ncbi:MAG: geranylgeranyl reductase family protein [Planctomycetes bacterium]|nr:geranylgeranyl reductase family protein [Planctomycetota bacterium]